MGHVYLKFLKKLTILSSILCFVTPDSEFPNFNQIKLKLSLGYIFGSWFQILAQKVDKTSNFDEKRTVPLFLVKHTLYR